MYTRREFLKYAGFSTLAFATGAHAVPSSERSKPEIYSKPSLPDVHRVSKFRSFYPEALDEILHMDDFGVNQDRVQYLLEEVEKHPINYLTNQDGLQVLHLKNALNNLKSHKKIIYRVGKNETIDEFITRAEISPRKPGESNEDFSKRGFSLYPANDYIVQKGKELYVESSLPDIGQLQDIAVSLDYAYVQKTIYQTIKHMNKEGIDILKVGDKIEYKADLDDLEGKVIFVDSKAMKYPDIQLEFLAHKYVDKIVFSPSVILNNENVDGMVLCNNNIMVRPGSETMSTIKHEVQHLRQSCFYLPRLIDEYMCFRAEHEFSKRTGLSNWAELYVEKGDLLWQAKYKDLFMNVYPHKNLDSGSLLRSMITDDIVKAYKSTWRSEPLANSLLCAKLAVDDSASIDNRRRCIEALIWDKEIRTDALAALEWLNAKYPQ